MDISGPDETDFRPFFDMVIGILFVLLILVAAQIYFQQAQGQGVADEAARREAALRRAAISTFLSSMAERLRAAGLAADTDPEAGSVVLRSSDVVSLDATGRPDIVTAPAAALGSALATLTACVTQPRSAVPACAGFEQLHLEALAIRLRTGALPPTADLPRDRSGDLAVALLSAALLRGTPGLIEASTDDGGRVVTFGGSLAPAGSPGDVTLAFDFR